MRSLTYDFYDIRWKAQYRITCPISQRMLYYSSDSLAHGGCELCWTTDADKSPFLLRAGAVSQRGGEVCFDECFTDAASQTIP